MSIFYYIYRVSLLLVSTLYSFFLSWFLFYFPCTKIWACLILPGNKCKWNFNTIAYAQLSLLVFHYFVSAIRPTLVEFYVIYISNYCNDRQYAIAASYFWLMTIWRYVCWCAGWCDVFWRGNPAFFNADRPNNIVVCGCLLLEANN